MNYLTLLEIADLTAELLSFEDVTACAVDASLSQTIGVYQREQFVPRECVGGAEPSYQTARLRFLVRWSSSPTAAEAKAAEVAELLSSLSNMETSAHIIRFADVKAVRSIGKDEKGVCEYVVDADMIYSERNE